MALDGTLKYWNNGEPTIPDESLTALKYWNNGEPYVVIKPAAAPPSGVIGIWGRPITQGLIT